MGDPTLTTERQQMRQAFRAAVAEVAVKAKAILPQSVNGRIEAACKLVLNHDVTPQEDGSIHVASSTDPAKTYHLVGATCECQDFQHGKAPQGWCQHRIAAGIAKRVTEMMPQEPAPEAPATAPLPEAPASVNVRVLVQGHEVQWTLRDTDETRLAERLQVLLKRYPTPVPTRTSGKPAARQWRKGGGA